MASLIELNSFVQASNGVFSAPQANTEFGYTDGAGSEHELEQILRNANDLSSDSAELQAHIHDWPTEYHLSATRANLLRALNLNGVKRVLELGCGCGSITRYLGEQDDIQIDAIEGSPSRAALAALRCRDQRNVIISTANFNDIQLPKNYYDLVLYVGVTEYAGRFSPRQTDRAALQDLLAIAKSASKESGVTLVAIENRLGLKYMLGAKEDHYAVPFVGIENYPESTGVRTYSKGEWQHEAAQAGFSDVEFIYPFPDYKIPTLLVAESAINNNDNAADAKFYQVLEQIESRDYNSDFACQNEAQLWQAMHQAGTFGQHANSFMMLMSDSLEAVKHMTDFAYKAYHAPSFNYLRSVESAEPSSADTAADQARMSASHISNLQSQITAANNELALLKDSKGWRLLNGLRRLFGKNTR